MKPQILSQKKTMYQNCMEVSSPAHPAGPHCCDWEHPTQTQGCKAKVGILLLLNSAAEHKEQLRPQLSGLQFHQCPFYSF